MSQVSDTCKEKQRGHNNSAVKLGCEEGQRQRQASLNYLASGFLKLLRVLPVSNQLVLGRLKRKGPLLSPPLMSARALYGLRNVLSCVQCVS